MVDELSEQAKRHLEKGFTCAWTHSDWIIVEQMLLDISRLFEKNKLRFFLTYGTLLGAIRHQGVIPWDDDVDLAIFECDEQTLRKLGPEFEKLGYRTRILLKNNNGFTETVYKLSVEGIPKIPGVNWSWPFIDIFVVRAAVGEPGYSRLDHRKFPTQYLDELTDRPFGNLKLPTPKHQHLMQFQFGSNCLHECRSTEWSHKAEIKKNEVISCDLRLLKKTGYLIDVHVEANTFSKKTLIKAVGTEQMEESGFSTTSDQHGETSLNKYLWKKIDGVKSIDIILRDAISELSLPAISAVNEILTRIDDWLGRELIIAK